jgi:uncharacterized protein (DUF427 family)
MRAVWNGVTIAQSDDTVVVEGNHYFPLESVDPTVLHTSSEKSLCPWKGVASYYHVELGQDRNTNAAWSYRHPYPWIRKIKGRVAFWNGVQVVREESDGA